MEFDRFPLIEKIGFVCYAEDCFYRVNWPGGRHEPVECDGEVVHDGKTSPTTITLCSAYIDSKIPVIDPEKKSCSAFVQL